MLSGNRSVIYLDFTFKPIGKKNVAMGNIAYLEGNRVYVPFSILSEGGEGTGNVCEFLKQLQAVAVSNPDQPLSLENVGHIIIDESPGEISGINKFYEEMFAIIDNSRVLRKQFIKKNIRNVKLLESYFGKINYPPDDKFATLMKEVQLAFISCYLFPTKSKVLFCTWHKSSNFSKRFGKSTVPVTEVPNEPDIENIELFKAAYQDQQLEAEEEINLEEEEAEVHNDQATEGGHGLSTENSLEESEARLLDFEEEDIVESETAMQGGTRVSIVNLLRRILNNDEKDSFVAVKNLIQGMMDAKPHKSSTSGFDIVKGLETLSQYFQNMDQWALRFRTSGAYERPTSQCVDVFHNMIKHEKYGMDGRNTSGVFDWFCKMKVIMTKFRWVLLEDGRYVQTLMEKRLWGKLDINDFNKFAYFDIFARLKRAIKLCDRGGNSRSHPPSNSLEECKLNHSKFCPSSHESDDGGGEPCIHVQIAILINLDNGENDEQVNQVIENWKEKLMESPKTASLFAAQHTESTTSTLTTTLESHPASTDLTPALPMLDANSSFFNGTDLTPALPMLDANDSFFNGAYNFPVEPHPTSDLPPVLPISDAGDSFLTGGYNLPVQEHTNTFGNNTSNRLFCQLFLFIIL
ncbi:unnamed protein product [Ambrosiozyma monospora]|uniref:Unnamed protein product n=1 Tax=Ambrosiozyma monospora TaxID=43982 RepID=A0ACB5T8C2_AMBMO|nr:unnamed protein product [Ambrosiozyma monospora]